MKIVRYIVLFTVLCAAFIACDEEFATVDSDIINQDTGTNFNTKSLKLDVISNTEVLGPVQTNGLGTQMLGVFDDPNYGRTEASILTQVTPTGFNPSFGDNVVLDSVVVTIPYFSVATGADEDNNPTYQLQSILPVPSDLDNPNYAPLQLSIFENNHFLRDFDPNGDFDTPQNYFSNKSASASENINPNDLEFLQLYTDTLQVSNRGIILTNGLSGDDKAVTQRLAPAIRLVFTDADDPFVSFFQQKIFDLPSGSPELSNANNFNNYFRGLFIKAEPINPNNPTLAILNLQQADANITIYYTRDASNNNDDDDSDDREQSTYGFTFGSTNVNFLDNDFTITQGDSINGDARLRIKGGEGAVANIKLFNGENIDDDENATLNTFEAWRNDFINVDEDNNFESFKRLINEANLIFYVDQDINEDEEPNRLYIYNRATGAPLLDYFEDSQNTTLPSISVPNHLGILERDGDDGDGRGIRYKMKITSHLLNILENNAENVDLGLAVSGNVNLEATIPQFEVQTSDNTVPVSALVTPRGTVLHGSDSEDVDKRLQLQILYTCIDAIEDCDSTN